MPRKNKRNPGIKNGRPCSICDTDKQQAVDLALAAGKTARFVSQSYGLSVYAVQRHRAGHLRPGLARAAASRESLSMAQLVSKLQGYIERLERGMEKAESKSDLQNLGRLVKESAAIVVRLGQLQGSWSDRPQIDNRSVTVNHFAALTEEDLRVLAASYRAALPGEKREAIDAQSIGSGPDIARYDATFSASQTVSNT